MIHKNVFISDDGCNCIWLVAGWWLVVCGWWLVVYGWWLVVCGWRLVVGGWQWSHLVSLLCGLIELCDPAGVRSFFLYLCNVQPVDLPVICTQDETFWFEQEEKEKGWTNIFYFSSYDVVAKSEEADPGACHGV